MGELCVYSRPPSQLTEGSSETWPVFNINGAPWVYPGVHYTMWGSVAELVLWEKFPQR